MGGRDARNNGKEETGGKNERGGEKQKKRREQKQKTEGMAEERERGRTDPQVVLSFELISLRAGV